MPWDTLYQKVLTAASSKDGPDIVAMSASRLPQYAAEGLFQPIDDYYEKSPWVVPGVRDPVQRTEHAGSVPRRDGVDHLVEKCRVGETEQ